MTHMTLPMGRLATGWQCNPPPACPAFVGNQPARPPVCRRAFAELTAEPAVAQQDDISRLQQLRLITAIKTPYLPSGKFDLRAYDRLVQHQVENGVEGLVIGGTTGEGQLMSWDEHVMLIAHTVNAFGDRLAVIGNTGSNSTREALHATEQGFAVGMHASLQINPYYGKTSRTGLMAHFTAVLQVCTSNPLL
ncbi:hypothetical protein WJX74_003819 [Apatococcus lobatus]|uniref:4-hydroxy-tetrahydrodipicolinate synthase n=1 Tax=Apatococcus lobatus TaxID=904363 RepID=A0AAW1QDT6_9CHLO